MGRFLRISQFLHKRGAFSAKIFVGLFLKYRTGLERIVCAWVPRRQLGWQMWRYLFTIKNRPFLPGPPGKPIVLDADPSEAGAAASRV